MTRREVGAVVGEERHPREVPGDLGVGAAEAVGQLLAELRAVGVAHDGRGHRARPAEVVAVQRVQQPVDVRLAEPADVVVVVDVARRGADQHQPREALGLAVAASTPIIALTECPTKTTSRELERAADLDHVLGVACSERVRVGVVRADGPSRRRRRGRRARPGGRSSNAGATKRHMFWSQPKPWANTIGGPSVGPWTLHVVAREDVHQRSLGAERQTPSAGGRDAPHVSATYRRAS